MLLALVTTLPATAGPTGSAGIHAAVPVGRTATYDHPGLGIGLTGGYRFDPGFTLEATATLDQFLGSARQGNSNDRAWSVGIGPAATVGPVTLRIHAGYALIEGRASDYSIGWSGVALDGGLAVALARLGPAELQIVANHHAMFTDPGSYPPLGRIYMWTDLGVAAAF